MNKVTSQVALVVNSKVVARSLLNWADAVEAMESFFQKNPEEVGGRVEFINYVGIIDNFYQDFEVSTEKGELCVGDLSQSNDSEKYVINEGEFDGKEFENIDDLTDFLKARVASGDLDLDDVQSLEIIRTFEDSVLFDNAEIEDDTYSVEVTHGVEQIVDNFGLSFVLASEANEEIEEATNNGVIADPEEFDQRVKAEVSIQLTQAELVNVARHPREMTDKEIEDEMKLLQTRVLDLAMERKREIRVSTEDVRRVAEENMGYVGVKQV